MLCSTQSSKLPQQPLSFDPSLSALARRAFGCRNSSFPGPLVGCYAHVIQDGQGKSISYRTLLQGFLRPVKEGPTGIFDHLQHARWWGSSFIKMACSPSACHCTLLTLFKPKIGQTCVLPTKFRLQQVSSLK